MCKLTVASLSLFATVAAGAGFSNASAQPAIGGAPAVSLPNTHVHVLHSKVNGRDYLLQVALPSAYVTAKPGDTTRYRTLYLLDGQLDFALLFAQMQFVATIQQTKTILVGVSAADSQAQRRGFDYTPPLSTADSVWGDSAFGGFRASRQGGAKQFLRVLSEEVIPLIDRFYPTSADRGIEGSSLGGLFVAYAMFEEPDLFRRYAMISPSLWYPFPARDNKLIFDREREFAKRHPTFPKTVFISVGAEEDPGMVWVAQRFLWELCRSLSQGQLQGLNLATEILPGEGHASLDAKLQVTRNLYSADTVRVKPRGGLMRECP